MNRKSKFLVKRFRFKSTAICFVTPRIQDGDGGVGFWGCFNFNGIGLRNINPGRINQYIFIEILENCIVPSADTLIDWWQSQQDMDLAHTFCRVKAWNKRK